jgi:hypothetical protein
VALVAGGGDHLADPGVAGLARQPLQCGLAVSKNMPLVVFRVQAADGRGPWRPGWSQVWIDGEAPAGRLTETVMDLMPVHELLRLPPSMMYGSACRTLPALLEWFTPRECQRLMRLGFHPVRLNADVVLAESRWQILIGRYRPFHDGATRLRWP